MNKILGVAATAVTAAGLATAPGLLTPAHAMPAKAKVTITVDAPDDLEGVVKSTKLVCKREVTVRLWEQVGTKGGGNDIPMSVTDTTGLSGGKWTWSFGSYRPDPGTYYVAVKGNSTCKRGTSPSFTVAGGGM